MSIFLSRFRFILKGLIFSSEVVKLLYLFLFCITDPFVKFSEATLAAVASHLMDRERVSAFGASHGFPLFFLHVSFSAIIAYSFIDSVLESKLVTTVQTFWFVSKTSFTSSSSFFSIDM